MLCVFLVPLFFVALLGCSNVSAADGKMQQLRILLNYNEIVLREGVCYNLCLTVRKGIY